MWELTFAKRPMRAVAADEGVAALGASVEVRLRVVPSGTVVDVSTNSSQNCEAVLRGLVFEAH